MPTTDTRTRIMDIAEASVLAKGFDATSIEEIVVAAEITKGGFFYHFRDKAALAEALISRYIESEEILFDNLEAESRSLNDDPLGAMLIWLELLARVFDDMPNGHPGCLIASATYQDRLFDRRVIEMNRNAAIAWRLRFRRYFDEIETLYVCREPVDLDELADTLSAVVEGALVLGRAVTDSAIPAQQVRVFRKFIKLLFTPRHH